MKKIISFILVSILLISLILPASAAPLEETANVVITATSLKVNVGESVDLCAVVEKKGSDYYDSWSGAGKIDTFFDTETESYKSTATFKTDKAGIYIVKYTIIMEAGKSGTIFVSEGTCTIEVIGNKSVIGAEIRNLTVKPVYRSDGSISMYSASGNIYALWSNNTSTLYSSVFFNFGINETSKSIGVTIVASEIKNTYTLIVYR
jgi:hypothetical protein